MRKKPYKIKHPKKCTHEQWGEFRKKIEGLGDENIVRIGASDVSVITGSNRWKCKMRLFYHLTGYHNSFFITEQTLAGHLIENITASRYESMVLGDEEQSLFNSLNKVKVRKVKNADFFLLNDKYPNSFVSLDYVHQGEVHSPWTGELYKPLTPIELKHTNLQYYKKWNNGIAQQYLEQVQYQMLISETDVCVFLVLVDGVNFHAIEVYADKELQDFIMHKVNEFADKVRIGKMALQGMKNAEASGNQEEYLAFLEIFERVTPEPVGMASSNEDGDNVLLMKEIYDESNGLDKQGDDCDEHNMNQYLKCNRMINKIKDYKDLLKAKILISCEDFEGLTAGERKCINRRATEFKKAYFSVK